MVGRREVLVTSLMNRYKLRGERRRSGAADMGTSYKAKKEHKKDFYIRDPTFKDRRRFCSSIRLLGLLLFTFMSFTATSLIPEEQSKHGANSCQYIFWTLINTLIN